MPGLISTPQAGREQKAGAAQLCVLTDQAYNRSKWISCGLSADQQAEAFTPSHFQLSLTKLKARFWWDHLKSMDWEARHASFHSKADAGLLSKVRGYIAVLLRIH